MYWWLRPSRLALGILLPIFLVCSGLGDESFALYGHMSNYLSGEVFWLGLASLLLFAGGAAAVESRDLSRLSRSLIAPVLINRVLLGLYVVTILANLIFLFPVVSNLGLVMQLASGSPTAMYDLRETLNQIPGITSFVGLQSLCMTFHFGYRRFTGLKIPPLFTGFMVTLVALCLLRAWLWSERLALLELALPVIVLTFSETKKFKPWLVFAPFIGFAGLFVIFSFGEYFRSWQNYQGTTDLSYFEFMWARFAGYYATALNNGASIVKFLDPAFEPINTAQWFYKFPLWALLGIRFDGNIFFADEDWFSFLDYRGNAEFNNPSGLFVVYYDYGILLGLFVWFWLGLLCGALFRSFARRGLIGLILYPVWFIGILEIPLIFYWGGTRFFPVLATALILTSFLGKRVRDRGKPERQI
jgi:hypothetical protein